MKKIYIWPAIAVANRTIAKAMSTQVQPKIATESCLNLASQDIND